MKFKNIFSILFVVFTTITATAQQEKYKDALEIINVWLEAQKDYKKIPGISVAIVKDQDLIWASAYGKSNIENGVTTEKNTLYSICSISKLFTSIAIMKLYDEGKLRLDDKIEDILPWYNLKQQFPNSSPITIRTILSHSAGLPRENYFSHWNGPVFNFPTKEKIKNTLKTQETLYPASTEFQYSNLGISLLGYVIEEITKVPYEKYIEENILKPLKLNDTKTYMPKKLHGKELAIGYSSLTRKGDLIPFNFFEAKGVAAAAGFSSNVLDLARFASWQLRLLNSSEKEIIKPSTLKYMQNVHWTNPDFKITWGLGFAVYKGKDGSKWVGHGGHCPGYKTSLSINPKTKLAYAVMANTSGFNAGKYARAIHEIIQKAKSINKKDKPMNLEQYKGFYLWDGFSEVYLGTWGNKLALLRLPSENPANGLTFYKQISPDNFRRVKKDKSLGEHLTFTRDANNNIINYKVHNNYIYTKVTTR